MPRKSFRVIWCPWREDAPGRDGQASRYAVDTAPGTNAAIGGGGDQARNNVGQGISK
jgi:hypothetical protein